MGGISGTPGHVTITPVYWAPSGYSFSPTYKAVINGYLKDVAAASRSNTNVFSVSTQYYQQSNATGAPIQHIEYVVAADVEVDDTSAFPASGSPPTACAPDSTKGFTACVMDTALATQLQTVVMAAGKTIDDAHLYVVLLPPNVETCLVTATGSTLCNGGATTPSFCAYHSAAGNGPYLIYANEPFPLTGCFDPTNGPQAPNGDANADAQVSLISHEANESITDWAGAWFDSAGFEDGDQCLGVYGLHQGVSGAYYNQVIGTGHYYTQLEFSNEDYALNQGEVYTDTNPTVVPGCVHQEEPPTASFSGPANGTTGAPAAFDASASTDPDNTSPLTYLWAWGDGTPNGSGVKPTHTYCTAGVFSVTLTVTDVDGWQATVSHPITVTAAAPIVSGVAPTSGSTAGGTTVTVNGCGFGGTTAVNFGSTASASYTVVSATQISATSPAHAYGTVDVTVTTPPGTSATSPADQYSFTFCVYTLDGWGGVHGDHCPSVTTSAYWPGWKIAKSARSYPGSSGQSGFVLDGWGGLHGYGTSAPSETSGASGHYWPGWDIARDFAFLPNGQGGVVLDGWGGLHGFGLNGSPAPTAQTSAYWPGWDIARKVVIFADGSGGYVMDGWGGLHSFGINAPPPSLTVNQSAYWPGWNIARDVVLIPGDGNHAGYVLDGWGGLHPFYVPADPGSSMPPSITPGGYWPGWDIARAVWLIPGSADSGYTLDGWGGLHPFGPSVPAISGNAYWPGWDIAVTTCGG